MVKLYFYIKYDFKKMSYKINFTETSAISFSYQQNNSIELDHVWLGDNYNYLFILLNPLLIFHEVS